MPPEPNMPTQLESYAGEMPGADTRTAANPHVLQDPIVDKGEWLAVAGTHQQDQTTVRTRLDAILVLAPETIVADGQVITSDFIRMANIPSFVPSAVPHR